MLREGGKIIGVPDVGSPVPDKFSEEDARALEKITELISLTCARMDQKRNQDVLFPDGTKKPACPCSPHGHADF